MLIQCSILVENFSLFLIFLIKPFTTILCKKTLQENARCTFFQTFISIYMTPQNLPETWPSPNRVQQRTARSGCCVSASRSLPSTPRSSSPTSPSKLTSTRRRGASPRSRFRGCGLRCSCCASLSSAGCTSWCCCRCCAGGLRLISTPSF